MGQLFTFFRNIGQSHGYSSGQRETESIKVDTPEGPEIAHSSRIAASATGTGNPRVNSDLKLKDSEIEGLAREMEVRKMESIAIKDLGIGIETVNSLKAKHRGDYIGFNRELLLLWRNKNAGINQVQRLADIFYAAAKDGGLVDPHKVQQILKVPKTRNAATGKTVIEEIITEAEFLDIAEKMKPHLERRMKIEPFPWLRDYYIDMNKLYTELTLEKIENELLGEKRRSLKGYIQMFDFKGRDKILFKADPGMGKTALGKKIGWDWGRGILKVFSMVFFVFLKLVQPGELIENVILKQNPELEGFGVSVEKLSVMLDKFGNRCLLILDGLDEHGLGKNEDVLKIIRNQKLINCGIIISSRPHSTKESDIHFETIVNVEGFTSEQAKRFASKFFTDTNKIKQVVRFKPSDLDLDLDSASELESESESDSDSHAQESYNQYSKIQRCPILLSFFCYLVAEQEIDLSDDTISMGDIYYRLVKCLYKKFTLRKGKEFDTKDLFFILKSIGKLALQTLKSNNPLLQRREVLRIVGDFAFEYGLFAGHEDIKLLGDPTADIYVTYPHRSLEEFLGSFGFIDALSEGKSVDDILGSDCKEPIFMVNPLVLRFCLWFLSSPDFDFPQRDECFDKLTSYVAKRIDEKVFDTEATLNRYPAINMFSRPAFSIRFFSDVLDKCKHIKTLHVKDYMAVDSKLLHKLFLLMSKDFIDILTTIIINYDHLDLKDADNNSLTLSIQYYDDCEALKMTNLLLQKHNLSERNPRIYTEIFAVIDKKDREITRTLSIPSHELRIEKLLKSFSLIAMGEFPHCPILTHFTIGNYYIHESVPSAFRRAMQSGKLPNLKSVTLIDCCGKSLRSLDWPDEVEVSAKHGLYEGH